MKYQVIEAVVGYLKQKAVISNEHVNPDNHIGHYAELENGKWEIYYYDSTLQQFLGGFPSPINNTFKILACDWVSDIPNFEEFYKNIENFEKFDLL